MIIIQDTREKVGHKNHILKYFERHNIQVVWQKLNVGDYDYIEFPKMQIIEII